MKTKYWLILSYICILPMFLSLMLALMAGISYQNNPCEEIKHFNHPFIIWSAVIGFLCISVIITTLVLVLPKSDSIDSLKETIYKYIEAKDRYENKFKELGDDFLKK